MNHLPPIKVSIADRKTVNKIGMKIFTLEFAKMQLENQTPHTANTKLSKFVEKYGSAKEFVKMKSKVLNIAKKYLDDETLAQGLNVVMRKFAILLNENDEYYGKLTFPDSNFFGSSSSSFIANTKDKISDTIDTLSSKAKLTFTCCGDHDSEKEPEKTTLKPLKAVPSDLNTSYINGKVNELVSENGSHTQSEFSH